MSYDKTASLVSIPIISKKAQSKVVGYIYLRVNYTPRDLTLFDLDLIKEMKTLSDLEKYQYFDQLLATDFNTTAHFGTLSVNLKGVTLPPSPDANQNLYMLKLKEGLHQTQVLLQSPGTIMDPGHQSFFT